MKYQHVITTRLGETITIEVPDTPDPATLFPPILIGIMEAETDEILGDAPWAVLDGAECLRLERALMMARVISGN